MAKPASFSASQGQSEETSTKSLPPLRYLAAGHKASPVSITPSSSWPPAPPPAQLTLSGLPPAHSPPSLRGKQEVEAAASPSPLRPGTAHTQL